MCVIHVIPFADPGRGLEIKDGFLSQRAVELNLMQTYSQLSVEGYLQAKGV